MKPRLIYLAAMSCVLASQFAGWCGFSRPLGHLFGITFSDGH
jgi:hypothetical protein